MQRTKWEYKIIACDLSFGQWKLAALGSEGWEAWHVQPSVSDLSSAQIWLKRPITPDDASTSLGDG